MPAESELRIKEVISRTYNVKSFRLEIKDDIAYKAGQFLCASLKAEKECKRYLSISSSPSEKGYIKLPRAISLWLWIKQNPEIR
jgi:glycine betaine catabolism B